MNQTSTVTKTAKKQDPQIEFQRIKGHLQVEEPGLNGSIPTGGTPNPQPARYFLKYHCNYPPTISVLPCSLRGHCPFTVTPKEFEPKQLEPQATVRYSDDRKKSHPFETEFDVLGVRLRVSTLHGEAFVVQSKPSRVEKIQQLLEETSAMSQLDKHQTQVVHDNLNFAMVFSLRKSLRTSAQAFAHLITDRHTASRQQVQQLCAWTHALVGELVPKVVEPGGERTPILVFTDAAYENDLATWGIVLIDPVTETRTAVSGEILGSQHVITLAESIAVLLASQSFL